MSGFRVVGFRLSLGFSRVQGRDARSWPSNPYCVLTTCLGELGLTRFQHVFSLEKPPEQISHWALDGLSATVVSVAVAVAVAVVVVVVDRSNSSGSASSRRSSRRRSSSRGGGSVLLVRSSRGSRTSKKLSADSMVISNPGMVLQLMPLQSPQP